jgi:hypothetical protein
MSKRKTTEEFIAEAKAVHGDKYDYSKVNYKSAHSKVTIVCSEHGEFEQTPSSHTHNGRKCKKCADTAKTTDQFITEAKSVHGDRYDYSKVVYKTAKLDVIITCKVHGDFKQRSGRHLSGRGCRKCAATERGKISVGFTRDRFIKVAGGNKAMVYLIKFKSDIEEFVKIGITKNNVRNRYRGYSNYKITRIAKIEDFAGAVWDMEKLIHKEFKSYKYTPVNDFGGYTECFSMEALPQLKQIFA